MITLYHAPRSRSSRFIFLLEELGVPYEIAKVSIRRGDGSGALDSHNPHPHGKVPAIRDGETLVYESIAVALYLTDKFPAAGIGPVVGDPARGAYLTWLAYYAGVMEPSWTSAFMKADVPRGTDPDLEFHHDGHAVVEKVVSWIDDNFTHVPKLLSTGCSAGPWRRQSPRTCASGWRRPACAS